MGDIIYRSFLSSEKGTLFLKGNGQNIDDIHFNNEWVYAGPHFYKDKNGNDKSLSSGFVGGQLRVGKILAQLHKIKINCSIPKTIITEI